LRSTTNLLRRGTAKKLAQDLQKAQSKQFLYSNQLNRLAADAPKNLVKTADDALQGATKEVNDILEKLNPYTKQKAKAGMTNQVVGKAMQGMGKAGEYVGNVTEFIRRAGIEEATTFLMKSGLSETAAKTVIFGSVGLATDMTDGEASLTGSGINALAAYLGPRAIASMGRSSAILGKQLTMAETSMPFFKRIGALPADNPKLAEVIVDRTDNLLLGDAASQLKPLLSQARELPTLVRNAARTIDRTGLGRVATGTANVAKAAVGGAALPGAFGYMIGGGEGAAAAIGASSPFIAAGLGYGSLLRYANKSDLIAKQLGDVEYHKQSLGERERADFEKLAKDQQVAVSTFSQFYPDAVIKVKSMGKDGPMGAHYVDGSDSIIEINADKNNSWSTILSHEIGHHVERHGLLPNILEELLGNPEKGKVGVFTQIDKSTGKPKITTDENGMKHYELNDEFRELQKTYIDKLANSNVSEKARQAYETPEQFARELFAEIVADRMITGKTSKRVGQSSIYKGTQKIIESLGDRITGGGFMRKAMHSLGMATNADGSLVKGTGILGKPFKSSKELDNLVKRYEDDTIGLSETEIREQRPVTTDDELDTVIVSPSDPIESLQVFNNGGHFKTDKDGNIKINPITKKPEVFSPSETRQANQALARDLIDSIEARENDLPEGHVTLSETADGKLTGSGKFIDDSIIDELSRTNRYNPSQINFLREASKAGREGIGNQMLLFYYAATGKGGRKYKSLKGGYRDSLVYGITITKDGNVILDTVSLDKLQKNIDFLLKRRGNEVGQAFGGSDPAVIRKNFESMFEKYLDNHAKGILNGDQNPQSGITDKQRNLLNAAFGPVSKAQIADNPTLSNLGERKANTLGTYRSRRLDRIGTMNPTGNTRNVVIDRIRRNLMPGSASPEGQRSFMPTETFEGSPGSYFRPKSSRDTSAQVRTFKSPVQLKDGSRLSGVADNPEQSPFYGFDKNGKEFSQGREYINPQDITKSRDSDRTANQIRNELESGQKLFIPAYHGTPHTLAPEVGAPLGRFRTSKIGTGEGAQAYGHGLYFAGKREVAEHYRNALGYDPDKMKINGRQINDEYNRFAGNPKATNLDYQIAEGIERLMMNESPQDVISYFKKNNFDPKAIKYIKDAKFETYGSLYKVELAPKENEYLLYDKTLGEQPKGVQDKLKKFLREQEGEDTWQYRQEQDYRDITNNVLDDMPEAEISKRLKEAGIPGIKYLDGSSRNKATFHITPPNQTVSGKYMVKGNDYNSKGKQFDTKAQAEKYLKEQMDNLDFNYVIFDEADVTVTEKLFMPASEAGATKGKVAEAAKRLKDLELSAKKDPLDSRDRNHLAQASLLEGIINESQGGAELDIRIGKHESGEGSRYIEYTSEDGDSFKIRATDHDRQLSSITNHRRPDFTLASDKRNVSESSGDWIDAIVKLENETDFRVPERLEDRINSIINRRKEIQGLRQEITKQERLAQEQTRKAKEQAEANALETPRGKRLSDEINSIRLELQNSSGTGKYTKNQRKSMFKKVRKLEDELEDLGTFDAGERNILFMPTQGDTTPASVQSWDGPNPTFGTNFTKGMVKDNKEAAALLRKSYEDQFGEPLRAQDFTEDQVNWLGDMFAKEGEAALGRTGNAVDWYTSAVERALAVAEEIFPDIGQKYEAKDRFLGALSITSQNMRVMDNAKGAVKQYQHKERTGKFDYSIKHGAKADAITKNLKLYDQAEAKMGAKDLHEFLDTDFTVKELSEWGRDFFGDKKFSIAGYSTDKVKGSAIFGPKIGQGFFQNLRGNYNPVTVDLWLRRTFGRLTGLALDTQLKAGDIGRLIYSVRKNVGKRKFSGLELPEFLKGVSITGKVQGNGVANFKISDQAYNRLFGDNTIGRDNYEAVYEFAGKLNKEWERRFATAGNDVTKAKKAIKAAKKEKKGTANLEKKLAKLEIEKEAIGKEKPQWAKAGSTVSDKLKPIDIPSNAERAVITKAFNVALKSLKEKGIDLTPADLQATLWYPEKDIWAFLKGENSDALNMSYDTAMEVIRDQR